MKIRLDYSTGMRYLCEERTVLYIRKDAMPLSPVELYEQLKPHLGEHGTKALIEYVDGKIRGEVATKEDLHLLKEDMLLLKADLEKQIQGVRIDLEKKIQDVRDEIWKLRALVIVVLVLEIILNPKVVELVGRILGVVK